MPLGIVSDEDFEKEIKNSQMDHPEIIPLPSKGRGNNPSVPNSLRQIIGENTVEEGYNGTKTLTRALGISDSSLSAYTKGATSTTTYYKRPNQDVINKAKERIVKKARNRLVSALNNITEEKLTDEKPRDLAAIAKDMSSIVRDFEPHDDDNAAPRALIIYAPQMVQEEKFDVIDVSE